MIRGVVGRLIPRHILASLRNYRILSIEYGQYNSMVRGESVDRAGDPIPWYSYPAIEFIRQLDFTNRTIFEYGSGNSTRFWAARCSRVVAVEDDSTWYARVKPLLPGNSEYLLRTDKDAYVGAIEGHGPFDIIVIDGSHRYECATIALSHLKDDGFVILDNSDWRSKTSQILRDADLIEVDMAGFGPLNDYTTTTSFYFTRKVQLRPAQDRQPAHAIGSLPHTEP